MSSLAYDKLKQNSLLWDLFTLRHEYVDRPVLGRADYPNNNMNSLVAPVSKYLVDNSFTMEYPENRKFAVCLTHDIDDIYPPQSHMLLSSLYCARNLDIRGIKKHVSWKFKGKDLSPYRNFADIVKLEEAYEANSSFYFIATGLDIRRFRYDIGELESELGFLTDKGDEVGLHGGYYSFNRLEDIKIEKKRIEEVLGRSVLGYRNHYLNFSIPDTWELLAKAGFKYDTTLGFKKNIGFVNGMCHPFRPYNLNTGQKIDIMEIPLAVMDQAIFELTRSFTEAWEAVKALIDAAETHNGIVTLLWHNYAFSSAFRESWKKLYIKILKYCYEKRAWMTSGKEIYGWYVKNGY
ncbi:conserved hypothetical protein [Methanocella paludicola SANAE]|uniref:NodB homology domain-containing protein n=1 Tax=Methanocella paludicola (strain DSM 17711 / JCM 13418 / NBRC 101707 / SANAE) TaxID=304371 RepID=D1YWL9_METPS|nr:polysaccharide deacetylase family protein [Methanocella paludicola]BAI60841.1 conserved hypothetical protein [Methanocella paludicola SANAE]